MALLANPEHYNRHYGSVTTDTVDTIESFELIAFKQVTQKEIFHKNP